MWSSPYLQIVLFLKKALADISWIWENHSLFFFLVCYLQFAKSILSLSLSLSLSVCACVCVNTYLAGLVGKLTKACYVYINMKVCIVFLHFHLIIVCLLIFLYLQNIYALWLDFSVL